MPAEFDFIDWVRTHPLPPGLVRLGPGDDLAILNWPPGDLLLIGADQVLDSVHFDSAVHSPLQIGRKAMNRNLSDCAAMGCLPAAAIATVALPRGRGLDYLKALYTGLRDAGAPFNCPIVGGDTASWSGPLALSVSILARAAGLAPLTRQGAKPGDGIYVTGPLGGSLLGRHMTFTPRVSLGRQLASSGLVTAMIDLSDGLSRDLPHICRASSVGAILNASAIPIHPDALELSRRDGRSPLEHALHDGEDYELLFTAPSSPSAPPGAVAIGSITAPGPILLDSAGQQHPLLPLAWEHPL